MSVKLPQIIADYVKASNAHDVGGIVACFLDTATVHDEGGAMEGKKAIESWIVETIEKYRFQFKPASIDDAPGEPVVSMEVSGTFDGSPITLDYRFGIEGGKIASLDIG